MKTPAQLDSRAFTLMELMIVVAIIAVIAGFVIPSFTGYIHNQNLRQARDKLVTDLRSVQNRALTGVDYNENQLYWGVKFFEDGARYYYFTVDTTADTDGTPGLSAGELGVACDDVDTSTDEGSKPLLNDVIIRNTADLCTFFSFDNGGIPNFDEYEVFAGYLGENDCMQVDINTAGTISAPADFVVCP